MRFPFTQIKLFALFAALLLTACAAAHAGVPPPPYDVDVSIEYPGGSAGTLPAIRVSWRLDSSAGVPWAEGVHIYHAAGEVLDSTSPAFTNIQTLDFARDGWRWTTVITGLAPGVHSFYLRAYNSDGESVPVAPIVITLPSINFPTHTADAGVVGEEYVGNAPAASSNAGAVLAYRLLSAPAGATIDAAGTIHWTPTVQGSYHLVVEAYDLNDSTQHAMKDVYVYVRPCHTMPIIHMKVIDANGVQYPGSINVYRYITRDTGVGTWRSEFQFRAFSDTNRDDTNEVEPGAYILHLDASRDYPEQWYKGTAMANATPITVACGDMSDVTFIITPYRYYAVSGIVTAQANGKPLEYAVVNFTGTETNGVGTANNSTRTGSDGRYSISLREGYTWTAIAFPGQLGDSVQNAPAYLPQYYNAASDPTQAASITPTADMRGIDFALPPRPGYNNGFQGTIRDSNGMAIGATVIAYDVTPGSTEPARWTSASDSSGYSFSNLLPGSYIIYAVAPGNVYVPGYYAAGKPVVLSWHEATQVDVATTVLNGSYDITLKTPTQAHGSNRIVGDIGTAGGKVRKDGDVILGMKPLAGALVTATDANGNVAAYALTGSTGHFALEGLGSGTYTVRADRVGLAPYTATVTFATADGESKELPVALAAGIDDAAVAGSALAVRPNPASGDVTVSFRAVRGDVRLTLVNAAGVQVLSRALVANDGVNSVGISTSGLAAGVYFVTVRSGASLVTVPLTIVR